jgi:uncharacterized repeat protein (TIGR01451 family)
MSNRASGWGIVFLAGLAVAGAAGAGTITVTTANAIHDAADGVCSLREAVKVANGTLIDPICGTGDPGLDTIAFAIPGPGPHLIELPSSAPAPSFTSTILDVLVQPVIVDGLTQPANGGLVASCLDGPLLIAIRDRSALPSPPRTPPTGVFHVSQAASGSIFRGIAYLGDATGGGPVAARAAIHIDGADNNRVECNFIGTDANGRAWVNPFEQQFWSGVRIMGASGNPAEGNIVGSNGDGTDDVRERNVISLNEDNSFSAVAVEIAGDANGNRVAGNYLGTDWSGTVAVPNFAGVWIHDNSAWASATRPVGSPDDNIVGTNGDGVSDALERNVISGNLGEAVRLDHGTGNRIAGNYLGTDYTGLRSLPNGRLNSNFAANDVIDVGATTFGSAPNLNFIGSDDAGVSFNPAEGNVIAGFRNTGAGTWNQTAITNLGTDLRIVGNTVGGGVASNVVMPTFRAVQAQSTMASGTSTGMLRWNRFLMTQLGVNFSGGSNLLNTPQPSSNNCLVGSSDVSINAPNGFSGSENGTFENNYWGAADGPNAPAATPAVAGSGDPVTVGFGAVIDVSPFLAVAPAPLVCPLRAAPLADLGITKTDGLASVPPGSPLTYTIVVSNAGPQPVTGASVSDVLPADFSAVGWTCVAAGGGSCTAGPVVGNVADTVNLPVGATATYTVTTTVSGAATGTILNTATVLPPASALDPDGDNNAATDLTVVDLLQADVAVTKTDGVTSVTAGLSTTYTIVVSNSGPDAATNVLVSDPFPAPLTCSTTSVCAGGAVAPNCGGPAVAGNLSETVSLPMGGTVTYTAVCAIAANASGILLNTVTLQPNGISDPAVANNTAVDSDTIARVADISITKTDGATVEIPGTPITYTIVASNLTGPSNSAGLLVSDNFPSSLSGCSWTCVGAGGGTCPAGPVAGNISANPVVLPVGASATFTATCTIASDATGSLSNTVQVFGGTDPVPANNSATDTDTLTASADLAITKTDGAANEVPGTPVTYTITATNAAGPSAVVGATVSDVFPGVLSNCAWTCAGAGGGTCAAGPAAGNIADSVGLPVGGSVVYTATCDVDSTATGSLSNTATIAAPAGVDAVPGNDSATDTDGLTREADLAISKTDGSATAVAGGSVTYTIAASNPAGPSAVTGASVSDTFPAVLTGCSWTCAGTGGAACPAGPVSGNIGHLVDLPVGGVATFTATCSIAGTATGTLSNTATISAPAGVDGNPSNDSATDSDTLLAQADLSITKTDGATSEIAGTPVTYTIVAANAGPSDIVGATVGDTFPPALTGCSWTCAGGGGGTCAAGPVAGAIADTVNLPVGGTATYSATCSIAPAATGTLSNTATVAVPSGAVDPNPANDSATDSDALGGEADLAVAITDGATTEIPGTTVTYTIGVSNLTGPSAVAGASVTAPFPTVLGGCSWTCVAGGGGSCAAGPVVGAIADTVNLPVGATATYTATCTIASDATGSLSATAGVSPPAGVTDPVVANDSATDVDALAPEADLSITKTDGATSAVPGTAITYTIVAANLIGPSAAPGSSVTDVFAAVLSGCSWTCVGSSGASCTAGPMSGNLADLADLPVGGVATYSATCTIAAAATGSLSNTAQVAPAAAIDDPNSANDSATDSDDLTPRADLSIAKSDGATNEVPGTPVTYSIVVANAGPSAVIGASVSDAFPASLTGCTTTCVGAAGGVCAPGPIAGNLGASADLPVGATVTYTATCTVSPSATGTLDNTAQVGVPAGTADPQAGNDSSTDSDTLLPEANLTVTKSDGLSVANPGAVLTYVVTVSNAGPSDAPAASVTDTLPPGFAAVSWTCTSSGGASCAASGTGDVAEVVGLPGGGAVTFTIEATLDPATRGVITNSASAVPGPGLADPNGAIASDATSISGILEVPMLDPRAACGLAALLGFLGVLRLRRG